MIPSFARIAVRVGLAVLAMGVCITASRAQDRPHATLAQGEVIGVSVGDIEVFKGLPFAGDAGGANRWRSPSPAPRWSTPRDASAFGAICIQRVGVSTPALAQRTQSEDCLNLNVWRPVGARAAPVMVWIHGGANAFGSGSDVWYDGAAFARRGIVLVTINYRVGRLGFFDHPALRGDGEGLVNYGLMDQVVALQWVHDNIASLGGDPANVTIFGESAGGSAVLNLIASPPARGLFAKAIVESGGGLRLPRSIATVTREGEAVVQQLGLDNATVTAEALRTIPAARFIEDGIRSQTPGFGAAVGGAALPEAPLVAIRAGHGAPVPLIIGVNSNEASLMLSYGMQPGDVIRQFGGRTPGLEGAYGPAVTRDDATYATALYRDVAFTYPARAVARAQSRYAPTWLYWFDYVTEARRGEVTGVNHAGEIPYVFAIDRTTAGLPAGSAADTAFASGVNGCWASLAIGGTPNAEPLCADWTPVSRDKETWFVFRDPPEAVDHHDRRQLDAIGTALSALNLD